VSPTFDYPSFDSTDPGVPQNNSQPWLSLNWDGENANAQGWWTVFNQGADMSLAPADDALRDHLKLPKGQGLVVTAVDGNSPAAQAGIQQNDVLVKLGDTALGKPEDLEENLKKAGDKPVSLSLIRNGNSMALQVQPRITVTLGPAQPKAAGQTYWLGVEVGALDPALRSQLQMPGDTGVIINHVINNSPAEKAGIKVHDVLLELDGKSVSDPHKLAAIVQAHGHKPINVKLLRAGGKTNETLEVTPELRESTASTIRATPARNFYFVRPGTMEWNAWRFPAQPASPGNLYRWRTAPPGGRATPKGSKPAEEAGAAVSKRLDALDAEIKQLRKAVEGLRKTEAVIDDLNKAVDALNRAAKENK
jgi:membrane-associated protease RseP (regulator of RpoE activity)